MPRKKHNAPESAETQSGNIAVAEAEPQPETPIRTLATRAGTPGWVDGPPTAADGRSPLTDNEGDRQEPEQPKNWGDPYKSIFSCPEQGFELGEHRRFKQRVFRFMEKPGEDIVSALKEKGFTYRATEKAWTIPADADTRKMTDEMAREWAGPNYIKSVEL
jgi:hypothetical protein